MLSDLRFAFRQLVKAPGFTAVAVLTLALGIGANTAIFSVINAVLLQPLPFEQPERLMNIWEASQKQNFPKAPLPPGDFFDLHANNQTFAALAAWGPESLALSGDGLEAVRLDGVSVTADLPKVLRVAPARGRFFTTEEFSPGRDNVAILSHGVWQARFAGDPAIVGRTIQLNGRAVTVIGILPESLSYPGTNQTWIPFAPTAEFKQRRDFHRFRLIGRLKDGVTYDQARLDLARLNRQFAEQFPETNRDWTILVYPSAEDLVSKIRPTLLVLVAAVVAVLLIACANVTNLLLARAAGRQQEIAVRVSLGATRGRIVRQLLGESLVLFALGGGAGVLFAQWSLGALLALVPPGIPRIADVSIDYGVLGFTSAVALGTGLVFGLIPAWQGSPADLNHALRQGGRGLTSTQGPIRSVLVVLQVSAAVMLLVVAGLLIRSFEEVRRVSLGFRPDNVLTYHLDLPPGRHPNVEQRARFVQSVVDTVATLPGVQASAATTSVPMDGGPTYIMRFAGRPPVTPSNAPVARHRVVSTDYFRAMGMTVVRGRGFTATDAPGSLRVCVINQTLAEKYFPNQDPLGQRLEIGFDDPPDWRVIVGIVADVKMDGLDLTTPVQVFEPLHQWSINNYTFVAKTTGDPTALASVVRAAVRKLEPTQPIHGVQPMTRIIGDSLKQRTFSLVLLAIFAAVALALASIGLYGVIAYNVAQRTREFGVRIAIGAGPREILRLVLGSGSRLIGAGLVLGLASAALATSLIQTFLFGVSPHDPLTYALVAAVLAPVAILACWLPARRATQVDPVVALRAE